VMEAARTTWTTRCPFEFDQPSEGWFVDAFGVTKVTSRNQLFGSCSSA
jgi:hypothetical protein